MAEDVAPGLHKAIEARFTRLVGNDADITAFHERIRDGTASLEDVSLYARRLGEHTSTALREVLTADALPDGRLYWNITQRTVSPALRTVHQMTNAAAIEVQETIDAAEGIGLNAIKAPFPEKRAEKLLNVVSADDLPFDTISDILGEPVANLCQSFCDDFVRSNAEFRHDAGMETTITRTIAGGACAWCMELAGTYACGETPEDIYRRHDRCRCTVTFKAGRFMQDVHSKRWYDSETQNALRVKNLVDMDAMQLTPAEASARESALMQIMGADRKRAREDLIRSYMEEHNVSHRRAANRLTRASK